MSHHRAYRAHDPSERVDSWKEPGTRANPGSRPIGADPDGRASLIGTYVTACNPSQDTPKSYLVQKETYIAPLLAFTGYGYPPNADHGKDNDVVDSNRRRRPPPMPQHNSKSSPEPNAVDAANTGTIDCREAAKRFNGVLMSLEPNTADAPGTIDCRQAAKKYNGVLMSPEPNTADATGTIDCREAAKKYNGLLMSPEPNTRMPRGELEYIPDPI
ncbi:hypothetical protein CDL15_Pgr000423 [Punica granatum]|nr:hypothetical protein CDL15_Pgr000423 [Punica granatum]